MAQGEMDGVNVWSLIAAAVGSKQFAATDAEDAVTRADEPPCGDDDGVNRSDGHRRKCEEHDGAN